MRFRVLFPTRKASLRKRTNRQRQKLSLQERPKKENLFSPVVVARAWVVYYRGQSLGGFLLSSLSSSYLNEREKGKNITQRRLSLFSPQGEEERTKLNRLLPFLIP